jgi:hypothetical protein
MHDPGLTGGRGTASDDGLIERRSPLKGSDSGLASRDYAPLVGGPTLVASWPLGVPPSGRGTGETWEVSGTDWETLQRNVLSAPQLGPLDHSPTYLVVCGRAHVDPGGTLSLRLANRHLSGKPYETTLDLESEESVTFSTPAVEFTPDRGVYEGSEARHYPEYALQATVSSGTGYVNAGTNVQLWSE